MVKLRLGAALLGMLIVLGTIVATVRVEQVFAPSLVQAEIFDVKKGAVIQRLEVTPEIREEAVKLVEAAEGEAGIIRADPTDGKVIRVQLAPGVEVRKKAFYALVTEAFFFLPAGKPPYLLIFTEENEPRIYALKGSVDRLAKLCGVKVK